jgi:Ca-activated chloride channel family protein
MRPSRFWRIPAFLLTLAFAVPSVWAQAPAAPSTKPPEPPAQGEPAPASNSSIRADVNLVDVLFTVVDRKNKMVSDLSQQNFTVFDDGKPQEIRFFSQQTDLPLRVGLLLDTSNSIRQRLQFEQEAAIDFLFNVIRRGKDEAVLMSIDDQPEVIQDFTGDLDRLRDAIQRQRAGGATALYDAIYLTCAQLLQHAPLTNTSNDVRRVLVVISDGEDTLSRHSRGEALEIAERAGIVIYTISSNTDWLTTDQETKTSNLSDRKFEKGPGDQVLQQFAEDSGGRAFFPYHVDDLAQSFSQIGTELRSQYSLAYTLPSGQLTDGKFHTIRVAVAEKGLQVHARKGYLATPVVGAVLPEPAK